MDALTRPLQQHRKPLIAVGAAVVLYTLAGFWGVPYLARTQAVKFVEQSLGKQLEITGIRFNPYRFRLRIDGLALREQDGTPLLGFDTLDLNAEPLKSLFARAWVLDYLRIGGLKVAAVLDPEGQLNLLSLKPPSDPDAAAPETTSGIPRIRFGELALQDGSLSFEDQTRQPAFALELAPISFTLRDFSTAVDYQNAYQFTAATASGETFTWNGAFSVQPLASNGTFAVDGLRAQTVQSYLAEQLPLVLQSGQLDLRGEYQLRLQPELQLDLRLPQIAVADLAVQLGDANGEPPLAFQHLEIADTTVATATQSLRVARVTLQAPSLRATRRKDGSLDLIQALQSPAAAAPEVIAAKPATTSAPEPGTVAAIAPWHIAVDRIEIQDGSAQLTDQTVTPAVTLTLAPITVVASGYQSTPGSVLQLQTTANLNQRAQFSSEGSLTLSPLQADFELNLQQLGLAQFQPYLTPYLNATLLDGTAGAQGSLSLAKADNEALPLRFKGKLDIAQLRVAEAGARRGAAANADLLRWQSLQLAGIDLQLAPERLAIERITLREPFARVIVQQDQTLNLAQLAKPAPASAPKPATAAGPTMPVSIRDVRIEKGRLFFADRSIEPSFAAMIEALNGSVRDLSTTSTQPAGIDLKGQVNRFSPVTIKGKTQLSDPTADTDVQLSFKNIELTTFNPYSGKFAGYNISKGKLSTDLSYLIERRHLQAEHHVVLDQLEFGEATHSKDAAPLPIKLAVSLLKDRNGVIDLELPVRGSLDDPEFRYGPIIWKVVLNTLTKIVTAPFSALGALIGGGSGEELAYVDFTAGSATLSDTATTKLQQLAQALADRPQLKLEIPAATSASDRQALAQQALDQKLGDVADTSKARLKALTSVYRQTFEQRPSFPDTIEEDEPRSAWLQSQLLTRLQPNDGAVERLARMRAIQVQTALLETGALQAERVFVTLGHEAQTAADGAVRIELKLQ